MGWFSFVTWLLFVSRVGCVGSHFVCGFRVCPVCWVCDHQWGRVLLSHRDVHFVVSRRESHSFVSVRLVVNLVNSCDDDFSYKC